MDLLTWCTDRLGSWPETILGSSQHLSTVVTVRLSDGREVVVKTRPWHDRLVGCTAFQLSARDLGFPCPAVIFGPENLDGDAYSAEEHRPGGRQLDPADPAAAVRSAELLARLTAIPPPAEPLPAALPWVGWDLDCAGLWPLRDDAGPPIRDGSGPPWLDSAASLAKGLLRSLDLPVVCGHGDWESQNLRWNADGTPRVVYDWDSVILQPEAAIAGAAAAVWTSGTGRSATVAQSAAFLDAFEVARGRPWAGSEAAAAWAAGLWVLAFNAKKDVAAGGGPHLEVLAAEVDERLARLRDL